jgi:hypothetical protein
VHLYKQEEGHDPKIPPFRSSNSRIFGLFRGAGSGEKYYLARSSPDGHARGATSCASFGQRFARRREGGAAA